MTLRNDVRLHFEREVIRNPTPAGFRSTVVSEAATVAVQRRSPQWMQAAIATLLALAIVAGLLAAGALQHSNTSPAKHTPPLSAPKLLFHDNLSGQVNGRPALWTLPLTGHVHSYVLAATFPLTPDRGTIYAVDSALSPTPEAVGRAFGVVAAPQVTGDFYYIGGIVYYPATGVVEYGSGTAPPGRLARPVTDQASAIALAGDFLVAHGLFSRTEVDSMRPSAKRVSFPQNPALWSIQFVRTLGGVPSYGFLVGATFQVHDDGEVLRMWVGRSSVSGSESATLIAPATAWREVTDGHWYAVDGLANTPIDVPSFHADLAELCYLEGFSWLIPMWCFTDVTSVGPDNPITLYYPALEPGTFDWMVPNRN